MTDHQPDPLSGPAGDSLLFVRLGDWLYNAGLLGLLRILQHADNPPDLYPGAISFPAKNLKNLEHHFFQYFADIYGKEGLQPSAEQFYNLHFTQSGPDGPDEKTLNDIAKIIASKITANVHTACEVVGVERDTLKNLLALLKDPKSPLPERQRAFRDIRDFLLSHKDIFQAKYVSYQIINLYWSNKSFLNKSMVKQNMFHRFREDFIAPIAESLSPVKKNKAPESCRICNQPISALKPAKGLGWLNMDLDSERKTSGYWNHKCDMFICPLCMLVYACVPAGFATRRRRGIFINAGADLQNLISANSGLLNALNDIDKKGDIENISYTHIINLLHRRIDKEITRELENIQIIKLDGDKGYSFNLLSKPLLRVLDHCSAQLNSLAARFPITLDNKTTLNIYGDTIHRLSLNFSLYPLINTIIRLYLDNNKNVSNLDPAYKIAHINMSYMNYTGGSDMTDQKINNLQAKCKILQGKGRELKNAFRDEKNKIQGIAYRMLNHLRTQNINGFMDVLINSHMHKRREVPTLFVDALQNEDIFQAYGYAFLMGFLGDEWSKTDKTATEADNSINNAAGAADQETEEN